MHDLSSNMFSANDPDNLDWIAFQYLSNELSETESGSFETLLAENQDAREALVAATQLIAGLKTLDPAPALSSPAVASTQATSPTRTILSSRTQQWALVSCAAVLLIAVTFLLNRPETRDTTFTKLAQTEPSQADLEHVLDLWSESAENGSITVAFNPGVEPTDLVDQPNVLAENHSLEIPDWLYTAVSLPEESVN